MIDIDKFITSMLTSDRFNYQDKHIIKELLEEQGLEFRDGSIKDILEDAVVDSNEDGLIADTIKQAEQKPVEWSEEDKKHIEYIEYLLNQEKYNHPQYQPNIDERIAWLKSLRPQKQQYDDEWSDEDKEFLKLTLSNLTELKDRYGEGYGRVGGCIDWLRSIKDRCTWKPSDEQMDALNYVVNLMASSERQTENDLYYNILKSLRQQLKKLKG